MRLERDDTTDGDSVEHLDSSSCHVETSDSAMIPRGIAPASIVLESQTRFERNNRANRITNKNDCCRELISVWRHGELNGQ